MLKKSFRNGSIDSPSRVAGGLNFSTKSQHNSQLGEIELPHKKEVFNGFKERMRENLLIEQARSLTKSSALKQYLKKAGALDVYVNTENV